MKKIIFQQVKYNAWANKKIAALLATIDVALIDKEIVSSFPSIRKTVHHIWDAELIWLSRLKKQNANWPPSSEFKNPAISDFANTSKDFIAFVELCDEEFLNLRTNYKNVAGKEFSNSNSGIIMHCMNHSTFHRGQILTMLRQVGITTIPQTDLIAYLREQKL